MQAARRPTWRLLTALLMGAAGLFCAAAIAPPVGEAFAREEARYATAEISRAALPREAQEVLRAITHGGPFAFERDGVVFGNYERLLPQRQRGYYREYTVPTPGTRSRGARRIIAGSGAAHQHAIGTESDAA